MVEVLVYWSNILIIYYLHYFAALLLKNSYLYFLAHRSQNHPRQRWEIALKGKFNSRRYSQL
jgi:hypothetical protein